MIKSIPELENYLGLVAKKNYCINQFSAGHTKSLIDLLKNKPIEHLALMMAETKIDFDNDACKYHFKGELLLFATIDKSNKKLGRQAAEALAQNALFDLMVFFKTHKAANGTGLKINFTEARLLNDDLCAGWYTPYSTGWVALPNCINQNNWDPCHLNILPSFNYEVTDDGISINNDDLSDYESLYTVTFTDGSTATYSDDDFTLSREVFDKSKTNCKKPIQVELKITHEIEGQQCCEYAAATIYPCNGSGQSHIYCKLDS